MHIRLLEKKARIVAFIFIAILIFLLYGCGKQPMSQVSIDEVKKSADKIRACENRGGKPLFENHVLIYAGCELKEPI